MDVNKVKNIIEALLIVSEKGLSIEEMKVAVPDTETKEIKEAVSLLKEEYDRPERSFNIAEIAERLQIVTKPEYLQWINNLYKKETEKLTGPSLETLAIIAYKQPVTRVEAESVRGVNVGGVLKTLLDKDLIQVKGRKDIIGRPLLYGTTEKFLEIFGLNSIDDLPMLKEYSEEDLKYGAQHEAMVNIEEEGVEKTNDEAGGKKDEEESKSQGVKESGEKKDKEKEEHIDETYSEQIEAVQDKGNF